MSVELLNIAKVGKRMFCREREKQREVIFDIFPEKGALQRENEYQYFSLGM